MACFYFHYKYTYADIRALENMHTKQLLNERNHLYHVSEYCADCRCDKQDEECARCGNHQNFNMEQVKRILATREHVLNKQESKALRKQRIKEGR